MGEIANRRQGVAARLARADIFVLLAVLALVGGLWLFVGIAIVVGDGDVQHFDERILLGANRLAPAGCTRPQWISVPLAATPS
jgi:hypothetical protein